MLYEEILKRTEKQAKKDNKNIILGLNIEQMRKNTVLKKKKKKQINNSCGYSRCTLFAKRQEWDM